VTQINTILLLTLRAEIFPDTNVTPVILNKYFQKRGELLEVRDENIFRKEPGVSLESVLMLQQHPELKARSVVHYGHFGILHLLLIQLFGLTHVIVTCLWKFYVSHVGLPESYDS